MTADATARPISDDETFLDISGVGPFTVYVKVNDGGTPLFGTSTAAAEYTEIKWHPAEESSNGQITFHFFGHNQISQLASSTAGLTFAAASNNMQVATCSAREGQYNFTVSFTLAEGGAHHSVDPIIVVTVPPMPDPR